MNGIAAVLLATAVLLVPAATAAANDTADVCWAPTASQRLVCYPDDAAWKDAVYELTGRVVLEEGESARGVLASFTIARLYEDASYGGSIYPVIASSSTICSTGSQSANLTGSWNDKVSSFRSYYGCTTRLYENSGQGGSSISGGNVSGLGAMNDRASSYTVT